MTSIFTNNSKKIIEPHGILNKFANDIFTSISNEFKKKHLRKKIMINIIEPLITDTLNNYYSYFVSFTAIMITIVLLLIIIIILFIFKK